MLFRFRSGWNPCFCCSLKFPRIPPSNNTRLLIGDDQLTVTWLRRHVVRGPSATVGVRLKKHLQLPTLVYEKANLCFAAACHVTVACPSSRCCVLSAGLLPSGLNVHTFGSLRVES